MGKILGKYDTIAEAAKDLGLTPGVVYTRLSRGWPLKEALGILPRSGKIIKDRFKFKVNGRKYRSLSAVAEAYNLSPEMLRCKMKRGMTLQQAVNNKKEASLSLLAKEAGVNYATALRRRMSGRPMNEVLSKESLRYQNNGRAKPIIVFGKEYPSHKAAAETYSIKYVTFKYRLRSGYTPEHAVASDPKADLNPINIDGITYPNIYDACRCLDVSYEAVNHRIGQGILPEYAIKLEISKNQLLK